MFPFFSFFFQQYIKLFIRNRYLFHLCIDICIYTKQNELLDQYVHKTEWMWTWTSNHYMKNTFYFIGHTCQRRSYYYNIAYNIHINAVQSSVVGTSPKFRWDMHDYWILTRGISSRWVKSTKQIHENFLLKLWK